MRTIKKVYRVVACIGRKRIVVWESNTFDARDETASFNAYKDATLAKDKYCLKLWKEGYSCTHDGFYHHIGKNTDAGQIKILRYSI